MAAELLENLSDPGLELTILQHSVTQLPLVQVGDIKLHNTVAHVDELVRNLRVLVAHPMSPGDRKVIAFIQGQADTEKARLDHLVSEKKKSILAGWNACGAGGSGGDGAGSGGQEGAGGAGEKKGFWKGAGRKIKKSFSSGSCGSSSSGGP